MSSETLEEMDSVSLTNFTSKCEDDTSICNPNVHNAGLTDLSLKESMVCDGIVGNNEFSEVLALPNAVESVTVKEPAKESDGVSLSDDPSSLTDVEVSRDGINLFVEVFGPLDGISEGKTEDILSLSHFDPLVFLARVKEFASGVYPSSKIELTVVKSHLASFYCSIGRLELPLQVPLDAKYKGCNNNNSNNNSNNNNNVSGGCLRSVRTIKKRSPVDYDDLCSGSKNVSGPRERKKSKFLSYPFTDEGMGKNSKKKGATKSLKDNHIISKEDDIRASSSKLLTNLHSMACGNFYGKKYSISLRTFYGSFRSYAYLDPDTADVEINRKQERIKKVKESESPSSNLESVKKRAGNNGVGKKVSKKGKSVAKGSSVMRMEDQSPISMVTNVSHDSSCMNTDNNLVPDGGLSKDEGLVCPNINVDNSAFEKVPLFEDVPQKDSQIFNVGIINEAAIIKTEVASFDQLSQPTQMQFPKSDEPKKGKMEEKGFKFADFDSIPDLNGDTPETMNLDVRSPSEKSTLSEEHETKKRAADREEDPGGSITLNFAPGSELPSKEILFTEFSRYGLVKQSEIKALNECVIQIPFERTPDVKFAHRSLERGHSFGESLLSFDLHCKEEKKPCKKKQMQNPVVNVSVNAFKNRARPVEKPDIAFMKQKVEGMKITLEKLGDKVLPETRVMLEKEIQAFLEKIGSGASSSS